MKFIVDEMPKSKSKCPFSEWKPYPPIIEEPGHYICKINHNDCNLCETECQLLKEQEAVVPTLDETTKRFYRCGVCGEYVGYIDSDPGNPNEQDNYCRNCGQKVKWE